MGNETENLLDALARNPLARYALGLFALCLAAVLLIGIAQNIYRWNDAAPPAFLATIDVWELGMVIGSTGTAAALLITLYVADRNYRRGREHIPSLTMTLELYRISASAGYDTVIAMLNAQNTGTGLAETGAVEWTLKVLSPYDDDEIVQLARAFDEGLAHDDDPEFPWVEVERALLTPDIIIEPNETEQMTYDFIIPPGITALVVSVWVSNAADPEHTAGWYRRAVHNSREGARE